MTNLEGVVFMRTSQVGIVSVNRPSLTLGVLTPRVWIREELDVAIARSSADRMTGILMLINAMIKVLLCIGLSRPPKRYQVPIASTASYICVDCAMAMTGSMTCCETDLMRDFLVAIVDNVIITKHARGCKPCWVVVGGSSRW
jgi:hypothetical protein